MKTNFIFFSILLSLSAHGMNQHQDIIDAAQAGDLQAVQHFIAAGADLNQQNNDGGTALMCAAWNGHEAVVQCLVQAGADLNQQDNGGRTALMCAAIYGRQAVVQYLVQAGADLNQQNKYGKTALMLAAYFGQKACCERLINHLMKIPSDSQKESVYAFLICMKRLGVVKDLRQNSFKKHLFADIEQVNWEKPEQSLAWQEIARIENDEFRQRLIATIWPQIKNNKNSYCSIQ